MKYKLGIDLGSTSMGWAVVELDDADNIVRLTDMGVRIFPDGRDAQSHMPTNVERRIARGMRRRNDRVILRKKRALQLIHKYGLDFGIKSDIARLENPYNLRSRAITEKLLPDELGRVLFHFAERRGFKSNRKEMRGEDGGKLKKATEALQTAMGAQTLGQFQYKTGKYRFSNQFDGVVIKDGAMYPTRDMYLDEFDKICRAQGMDEKMQSEFRDAIFFQRNLLPQNIGTCIFEPNEKRAYKYEPLFQKWRALQQVNQLRILNSGNEVELSPEQRSKLLAIIFNTFDGVKQTKGGHPKLTFAEIKKQLGLSRTTKFNLESGVRKELDVDSTAFEFFKIGELEFWNSLNLSEQSDVLSHINDDGMDDADLINFLVNTYNVSPESAEKIISIQLEDDVANVSLLAMKKMMPLLEAGQLYHAAATTIYGSHSDEDIKPLDCLPYYGDLMVLRPSLTEYKNGSWRTMNATVHIAMNQLRAVVNDLIVRYGKPYAISIEMGRDVSAGAKERSEIEAQYAKNKKENDKIAGILAEMNVKINTENIQKYKLWEMLGANPLDRRCVYTDELISREKLFSPEFEIEHILPFSRTLDDSLANKTISRSDANRFKNNRTPDEAFSDANSPWRYEDVWQRAQKLPEQTRWRFNRGALDDYLKGQDCIARALNDTRFMTRLAVRYLKHICMDKYKVSGVPGKMTAMFRNVWNLNWYKNKEDADGYRAEHIHHAIDAFVVACMGSGDLQKLSKNTSAPSLYSGKGLKDKHKDWFVDIQVPFAGFDYHDFKMRCEKTIVSYRKSSKDPSATGTIGCLHEDTAYNLEYFDNNGHAVMSRREPLPTSDAERKKFAKDFKRLNQTTLQMFLQDTGCSNDAADISDKFLDWCASRGIKKVRMLKSDVDVVAWVPVFKEKSERDAFNAAFLAWYISDGIAAGITNKKEKKAQQNKEKLLAQQYQNAAMKAYKWYKGGNNFCAEIFEIRSDDKRYPKLAGQWQLEIMSNYNAQLNSGLPMWHKKYPIARRVMSLRINDMVIAEFNKNDSSLPKGLVQTVLHQCSVENTDVVNIVFRVKKMNSSGVVYLRPHFVAKEDADTKSWAASASSLQKYKARKIHVSPTGKILK